MRYRNIERFKYQLAQNMTWQTGIIGYSFDTEFIHMEPDGQLTLKEGYLSDGPSGPTVDTPDSIEGAFLHDGLYECIRRELLPLHIKDRADRLLHDICTERGMTPKRADLWYDMVRKFAGGSCIPGTETKDIVMEV